MRTLATLLQEANDSLRLWQHAVTDSDTLESTGVTAQDAHLKLEYYLGRYEALKEAAALKPPKRNKAAKGISGPKYTVTDQEIALAMELRTEQISWEYICLGLGIPKSTLYWAIKMAEKEGMRGE